MAYGSFPEENGEERRTRVLFESPVCVQMASQVYIGPCVHASHRGHYFVSMAAENSTHLCTLYTFLRREWLGKRGPMGKIFAQCSKWISALCTYILFTFFWKQLAALTLSYLSEGSPALAVFTHH
jgi:hypothetical protein